MKRPVLRIAGILLLLAAFAGLKNCEKQVLSEVQVFYDPEVIPPYPAGGDTVMLIETICGSETPAEISIEGTEIISTRYFNSMMKMPCSSVIDTTLVGPLLPGSYRLIRYLIDRSDFVFDDSIAMQDTLYFSVVPD